jgi:hypothetical protein
MNDSDMTGRNILRLESVRNFLANIILIYYSRRKIHKIIHISEGNMSHVQFMLLSNRGFWQPDLNMY